MCGSGRVLELQLMPGLLHALDEGLAWQTGQGVDIDHPRVGQSLGQGPCIDDWNWLSIAIFTCVSSCEGQPGVLTFSQEQLEISME